jgi:hypothetical protein
MSLLLLCSCGKASGSDVTLPVNPAYRAELQAEINRIEPQLEFQNGLVSKQNGDIGDAGLHHALFASVVKTQALAEAYKRIPESIMCRSYEMAWLGPQIMQVVYGVGNPYACDNLNNDKEYLLQKNLTALNAKIAAETVKPGYRLHLLMARVYLLALQGNVTAAWADVANRVYRRDPANVFFDTVDNLVHSGSPSRYQDAANRLIGQMQQWNGITRTQFSSERDSSERAWEQDSGFSLVMMAKLLLKENF